MERKIFSPFDVESAHKYLLKLIQSTDKQYDGITVLCIGTDRATGDCLGPLVGYLLGNYRTDFKVIGTLDNPVHGKNLNSIYETLDKENNLIIAIDASLGKSENVGKFSIYDGCLHPGAGVGKDHLAVVGDITITGTVNTDSFFVIQTIQSTRLSLVYNLALAITETITKVSESMTKVGEQVVQSLCR